MLIKRLNTLIISIKLRELTFLIEFLFFYMNLYNIIDKLHVYIINRRI
jgi:hypothetical protein